MRFQNPNLTFFTYKKRAVIIEKLKNQFGIDDMKGIILRRGNERLFLYQGALSPKNIGKLEDTVPVERVGIYFGKVMDATDEIRLSIDGVQLFKDQITKNIIELDEKQADEWMHGNELLMKTGKNNFVILKYKDNLLGCGKASAEKITNFIPKNRRLKERG